MSWLLGSTWLETIICEVPMNEAEQPLGCVDKTVELWYSITTENMLLRSGSRGPLLFIEKRYLSF